MDLAQGLNFPIGRGHQGRKMSDGVLSSAGEIHERTFEPNGRKRLVGNIRKRRDQRCKRM